MIFLQTLADFFGAIYLLMDHPLYFVKVGFIKSWSAEFLKKWDWLTDVMWCIQVALEIPLHMVALQDMQKNIIQLKQERDQCLALQKSIQNIKPEGIMEAV